MQFYYIIQIINITLCSNWNLQHWVCAFDICAGVSVTSLPLEQQLHSWQPWIRLCWGVPGVQSGFVSNVFSGSQCQSPSPFTFYPNKRPVDCWLIPVSPAFGGFCKARNAASDQSDRVCLPRCPWKRISSRWWWVSRALARSSQGQRWICFQLPIAKPSQF